MKKWTNHNKIIFKRIISFTLVLVILVTGLPMDLLNYVSEDLAEKSGLELTAKAADVDSALLSKYSAHSYIFNSNNTSSMTIDGVTVNISLAEYSQCFQDPTWAEAHANDIIQLNPIDGVFKFDTGYNPIGNTKENCAFGGTIILTTGADEFNVQTRDPIFECVKDSVTIKRNQDSVNIPFNINRVADVGNTVSALFANHVIGTSSTKLNNWKVTLNANSVCSYSGVIYEMTNGAKINLTFEDKSDHTPVLDNNGNIYSGSIIDNKADNKNYGILCGALKGGSVLHATYTNANDDKVTFIGTETAYCGGLIGEINGSTFELLSGSSSTKVDFTTPKNHVGFICGHAEDSTITLPTGYTFQGTVKGTTSSGSYAGGIAGYCKNTVVNYATATGEITLTGCNIADGTSTGGVFGYYECDTFANDILINRKYNLTSCTVAGAGVSGGVVGEYVPKYTDAVTIDLDKYTLGNTIKLNTGNYAGGLIGKYTANGSVTITDTDTSTAFTAPQGNVAYGGVIGEYVNSDYANTLALSNFTVDGLSSTSSSNVGGIIRQLTGSTYVSVSGVSVTNVTATSAAYFGGIVSTLDKDNAGSFIDVTGNFTLSMASGKYKGGAIAGSFKKGVIRLAGTTDISGAQAENGYAQLVYENDETLVYAKGSGSDANWTLKRNASTTASDLGQWGEVVRLFNGQNAEAAGIVSVANNKVTVAQGVTTINDTVSFAKCALNMQLNDGSDHGALCFASGGANKTSLLSSNITVSGEIDLSGTGLLGLMRDIKTNDVFKGKIIGDDGQTNKITLAVGEDYGVGTGGNIYLSYCNSGNGHNAQGLLAYSQSAKVNNLTVDGTMNINRPGIGNSLYAGAVSGYVTGGISLNTVAANAVINFSSTKSDQNVYIGGVAGIYDENKAATGFSINASSITPTINISGNNALTTAHRYGGVLGYLNGSNDIAYDFTIENSTLTPKITIANGSTQQSEAYIGGLIAMVGNGKQQTITIRDTNITDAEISTKSQYAGGLLGHRWENVNVSIDGLSITGSSVNNTYSNAANNGGLVFASHGVWDVESISIDANSRFTTTNGNSFGLLVNEGYRSATDNNNGLYLKVKNSGLNYAAGITVTEATNMDEICVKTADNADKVVSGGDSVGVLSIDMNIGTNTETKISETGTYQNKITAFANRRPNSLSRYYYGLQLMKENAEATGGEQFLLWSVRKYASSNIKNMFKDSDEMIASTSIDLSGLSYYPIATDSVTLPDNSTVKFGFNDVKAAESNSSFNTDSYYRNPDDMGNARNQHYLMQTGLFTTVSELTANALTLTGDFGYVSGAASGALINKSTSGTVSLTGLTLDNLTPSNANSYLLINYIDGTGDALPSLTVSNLRATNYNATGVTLPVAKSLFGKAEGQNMTMNFSDIKLDARNGTTPTGSGWNSTAATNMDSKYGTSRSIFSTATFFTELLSAKTSTIEYNYTVEQDWGTGTPRNVTYGKEVTSSKEYENGEKRYSISSGTGHFTNPVSDSNTEFDFSVGFLPYVANYENKGVDPTYPVVEIKVNYKVAGLIDGCGTYNDPYIISTPDQLKLVADVVNNGTAPSPLRLPNEYNADHVITSWHGANGDGLYNLPNGESTYIEDTTNTQGISSWTKDRVRYYLASAYYVINTDLTGENSLPADFEGIGKPSSTTNGNTVFHGVIVGKKSNGSAPTITNPSPNPLIYISNGSVVKNLNINVTANISRSLDRQGDNALYGYKPNDSTNKGAEYYGGVIGEIMGGDNIIDDVKVTYSGTTTLSGNYKHLIAEGGMVGCVVNGALIFRGSNSVSGRTVTGGGIYSNPYVGRVLNGYAVYEKISGRTGTAPDNYNAIKNETKTYTYPIDTIDRSNTNKLDVNYTAGTITVLDAQSLYIMSLITQSIASTAETSSPYNYYKYSPSYGYNTDNGFKYINGVARLGDYSGVNCGASAAKPTDYSDYAAFDSVNNYTNLSSKDGLMKAPVPYIIYRYTTRYGTTTTNPAADFPARRMTFNNSIFWDITLSESDTFEDFDSFQAFRGIGCVGINAYATNNDASKTAFKVATFNGGGNTINLHISLPRYDRDEENYYHYQNKSLNQVYSGDSLGSPYGHDGDTNLPKLMGLGLFDCVMVKNDSNHKYQFKNFTLQGIIEDKVYNTAGVDITGTTGKTQLFCVGGVYGKRIFKNASDVNFQAITFDGLIISCAYSCGGLVGIDAVKSVQTMKIDGCNSTENGISVTGGCYGENTDLRHGVGSFVGMTFWTRPYIDGDDATTQQVETADISVSNVSTFYDGDSFASVAGGLIGYTGSGAEIKNVILNGLGTNPVIGSTKVLNAGGFIGFSQADNNNTQIGFINFDNCTLNGISVQAKNNAAGFLARCGNNTDTYFPRSINMSNCAVIGNSQNKPEIRAYGTNTSDKNRFRFGAGGFFADFSLNKSAAYGVIENCYIRDYLIEGSNVGGIIGTENIKPAYLKNIYVKDCNIITTLATGDLQGNIGGMVGRSAQNISGYNLKIDGVDFYRRSGNTLTDVTTTDAGIIVGRNTSNNLIDKFVGICAYHTTVAKVPTDVVKTYGTNTDNFFVWADYMNASASDTASTSHASTFNGGSATVDQPVAPFLTVNPRMSMGRGEYLTGDGAGIGTTLGNAGEIYKDYIAGSSNRRYSIGTVAVSDSSVGNVPDATTLAKYINNDGSYKNGAFKISTALAEFGTLPQGVQNFAMLVINDDTDKTKDITPFIKSYLRLVTNADKSSNQYKNNQYAYSYGNTNIDKLYKVVVRPCYYDSSARKYVLGDADDSGLKINSDGKYEFVSENADSEAGNYQFSLIDVQFKDPTDTTQTQIAYHLYVPVYTKKMLTAEFSAVSMTETKYYRTPYSDKISAELARNKSASDPSLLVESTDAWTTTFIRYTYPKKQISQADTWNYDKSVKLNIDTTNFQALPVGTKFILVDPNANADKYYTYELTSAWSGEHTLNLSDFMDNSDDPAPFSPQNLSDIMADQNASSGNELYEDYYISIYVPMTTGHTHGILVGSGAEMQDSGREHKANIVPKLYSSIVLGDLFAHEITENSFSVESGDGDETWGDNPEMTPANNVLKTQVTATIQIKNADAGAYLASSSVYHAFFISLTSHDADHKVSDIIRGTNQGSIHNTTTYSYTDNQGNHSQELNPAFLGPNYVKLETGNILGALYQNGNTPVVTVHSETTMEFFDVTAFPYNVNSSPKIGTQVSVKSSLAYDSKDLLFSSLNDIEEDPDGKFYYSTTKNNAELTFNGSREIDSDAIGYKTNNMSTLGVNGLYEYSNEHSHPLLGVAVYNVDDIIDYDSAQQLQYTVELSKKVTDVNGTRYEKVNNIGDYLSNVKMIDPEVNLSLDLTDQSHYVFTGNISHQHELDSDKMFVTNFSCNVLTGDTQHNEYANYKISITAELLGASNSLKDSYLIYTNAKIDPTVVDEP